MHRRGSETEVEVWCGQVEPANLSSHGGRSPLGDPADDLHTPPGGPPSQVPACPPQTDTLFSNLSRASLPSPSDIFFAWAGDMVIMCATTKLHKAESVHHVGCCHSQSQHHQASAWSRFREVHMCRVVLVKHGVTETACMFALLSRAVS